MAQDADFDDLEMGLAKIIDTAQAALGQLMALKSQILSEELKRANGRLTDAGVNRLRQMVDAGTPDSEVARELKITQSAVHHQRQRYLAEKSVRKDSRRRRQVGTRAVE